MSTPDVIEGTAEDLTPEVAPATEGERLPARRERRSEVIRPLDAGQLVESFQAYQSLLPQLLAKEDWQDAGRGEKFVKKSGWRKIATAFDLDVIIVSTGVERDADGTPLRAEVVARAIAPSGRSMDGDGYCSSDESRFGRSGGRAKLENDLRATATTRAKNRAIADLVGMGAVSAEEVSAGGAPSAPVVPEWAQPGNGDELTAAIGRALTCAGVPTGLLQAAGSHVWGTAQAAGGGSIPQIVVPIMDALGRAIVQAQRQAQEASNAG